VQRRLVGRERDGLAPGQDGVLGIAARREDEREPAVRVDLGGIELHRAEQLVEGGAQVVPLEQQVAEQRVQVCGAGLQRDREAQSVDGAGQVAEGAQHARQDALRGDVVGLQRRRGAQLDQRFRQVTQLEVRDAAQEMPVAFRGRSARRRLQQQQRLLRVPVGQRLGAGRQELERREPLRGGLHRLLVPEPGIGQRTVLRTVGLLIVSLRAVGRREIGSGVVAGRGVGRCEVSCREGGAVRRVCGHPLPRGREL